MLVAPSTVTRSPPRLPSADHRLTIPARPAVSTRRHSTTVGSLSPSHLSRPLRSSPLAGPSIAASNDGTLISPASAPPTPGGGLRHLSPLAEFSTTLSPDSSSDAEVSTTKKQRRRTLGAVFSKLNFPSTTMGESPVEDENAASPVVTRRRTKSSTSQDAPPVPPVPSWVHQTMPTRTRSPHHHSSQHSLASSSSSSSSPSRMYASPHYHQHRDTHSRGKSSRPTSPTPSAHSNTSSLQSGKTGASLPRRTSLRPPPCTSSNPESNWLTQAAPPRFSRLGLKAEGVILPVSAREAKRRSTASIATVGASRTRSFDALPPPPMPARTSSRASTVSIASLTASPPHAAYSAQSTRTNGARPSTAPATQTRFRSRASSRASLASAASGISVECDTPSLTMSPGPSASDVSSVAFSADTEVDEMGVLSHTSTVEFQLNDVPVGVLAIPAQAYKGKGKERAVELAVSAAALGSGQDASDGAGVAMPWMSVSRESLVSSSAATSVVDLGVNVAAVGPLGKQGVHVRVGTAPEPGRPYAAYSGGAARDGDGKAAKKTHTLGRVWRQVVRSVTGSSRR
ncbi:hypothetical protein C8Q73DRAFT_716207 [Cubamyces lactineus]|nr:hypothetical protein C8Q73DRAFT_716207 [Cubamyces lactineus]